jgi:hypothetical protein
VLKEEDWAAIQAEVARTIDPLLSETDLQRIHTIYQHLSSPGQGLIGMSRAAFLAKLRLE